MRADRLLSLLLLLQSRRRVPARELAATLEVSVRTIYRDVDALSAAGVPVYAEAGRSGGIELPDSFRTDLTGLSRREALALSALRRFDSLEGVGLSGSLQTALLKLAAALPAAHRMAAEHARQRLLVDAAPWFRRREEHPHLAMLRQAVWEDRLVRVRYRKSTGELQDRDVSPHALVAKGDRWYLVARAAEGMHVFRVSRVQRARLLRATFTRDVDFDLARFWDDWLAGLERERGTFVILLRLRPEAEPLLMQVTAGGIERELSRARLLPDGRKQLRIDFERENFALPMLLALGGSVEVLAPRALRAKLAELARQALQAHGPRVTRRSR